VEGGGFRGPALNILLDTHIWIWWLLPDSPLPDPERKALDRLAEDKSIHLPAICQWEAQVLHSKGRIDLPLPFPNWLRRATAADMLTIMPLDAEAVIAVQNLPQTFHGDPADRMIVATARVHDLPLATHDEAIRKSRLVKIWKP
jgi:PIN domain nuclease of toxin-antitoxin system